MPAARALASPAPPASELLTPAEVGRWLRLRPRQLVRYGVPHLRLGRRTVRYVRADVEAWLVQQRRLDGGVRLT
jgi:hypothetical protein